MKRPLPFLVRGGLVIVALLLVACAGPVSRGDSAIERAEQAYAAGEFADAARMFTDAAERAAGERRDYLHLRAAESHRQRGDMDGVRRATRPLRASQLSDAWQLRLELLLAEGALADQQPDRALDLLTIPTERVPDALRPRFHELRARAFEGRDDSLAMAQERAALLNYLQGPEHDQVADRLAAVLAATEVEVLYRASAGMSVDEPLKAWVDAALIERGVSPPRLLADGRNPLAPRQPPPTDADGRALYGKVVVMLPLSGALGAAGQAVRDGFFAAYFSAPEPRPQIELLDTGSTVQDIGATYLRALEMDAELVVGPLGRDAVTTLFREPLLPVPVLALNHADGVAPPPGSAQFGLLPDEEAVAAAERLIQRGVLRAGVVSLPDDWSRRAALAFRMHFESLGGEVVRDLRLAVNDYDFSQRAERLREDDLGGLFLALHGQSARLLVPQLKSAGVGGTWLAMARVYGGAPVAAMDRDLDGLEFSDAPWVIGQVSGLPSREELAASLRGVQGQALRLFAFGIDAYRLLGYIDWLNRHPYSFINGATGERSIDASRQVRRKLAWARFQDGIPIAVEGALQFEERY